MTDALLLPRLRPDQWAIVSHPAKRKKCCMGRRWGKSTMGGGVSLAIANQGGHAGGWRRRGDRPKKPACSYSRIAGFYLNRFGARRASLPSSTRIASDPKRF